LNGAGPALEGEIDPVCRRRSGSGSQQSHGANYLR